MASAKPEAPVRPAPSMTSSDTNNAVYLRGRLAAEALERVLPSGDVLCAFRLTVPRPPGARGKVDSLECASTLARVRRTIARARPGDELEVSGRLQRRFWRGSAGLASRYEVEARSVRVSARRRTGA